MYDEFGNWIDEGNGSFFDAARARVGSFLAPLATPEVSNQLMNAIYQFGAGKLDAAREKAVGAFMMTSEGRKLQAEGVRQTANQYAPLIVIGIIVLLFGGALLARR